MTAILALLLTLQDPYQAEIDQAVRRFEAALEAEQALTLLSAQLAALGARATNPIARRLARDLRDGMASAAAPAFIDALVGQPDAVEPLQVAFRDATTTAAGQIELAEALFQLDDTMTWRAGLIAIVSNEQASLGDRLRASKVLLEVEDPRIPDLLRGIVERLPGRSEEELHQVAAFLAGVNTPLTRELLTLMAAGHPRLEEPGIRILDDRPRAFSEPPLRPAAKKQETRDATFLNMPTILAGGVTLVLLGLLLAEILRKG
jgi:hypothetical protein